MPHGEEEQIFFNVSHTTGLIVLAVARRRALGVDVENLEASEMPVDVADRFFASSEVTALLALPSSQQQDRFFEYWTFKESYIKARGMGLSIPLDKFSFDFPSDRGVTLSIDTTLSDVAENWRFWQFRPRKEYLIAICAERLEVSEPQIIVRTTIPGQHEAIASAQFLRTSD
jgi:4'-phosphopantetheinyl transferase